MLEYQTKDGSVYVCDLCKEIMITPHDKSIKDASWLTIKMNRGGVTHVCPNCREDFRESDQSQVNGYRDPEPVLHAARLCADGLQGAWQYLLKTIAEYDAE